MDSALTFQAGYPPAAPAFAQPLARFCCLYRKSRRVIPAHLNFVWSALNSTLCDLSSWLDTDVECARQLRLLPSLRSDSSAGQQLTEPLPRFMQLRF